MNFRVVVYTNCAANQTRCMVLFPDCAGHWDVTEGMFSSKKTFYPAAILSLLATTSKAKDEISQKPISKLDSNKGVCLTQPYLCVNGHKVNETNHNEAGM